MCRSSLPTRVVAIQGRGSMVTVLPPAVVTRVAILDVLSQHLTPILPLGLTLPPWSRQCSMHLGAAFPLADRTAWFPRLVKSRMALFPLIIHSMFSAPMVTIRTLLSAPRQRAVVRPVGTVVTLILFPTSPGMILLVVLQSRRLQPREVALPRLTVSRPIRFTAAGFPRLVIWMAAPAPVDVL